MANENLEDKSNSESASLLDSFKQGLENANWGGLHRRRPTIYRVPELLRNVDREAYEPKVISIGPYHRGKPALAAMETIKWRYLNMFLSRNSGGSDCLQEYLNEMKMIETKARSTYWDKVDLESDEFVRMMLLDGCFIVEFLLQSFHDPEWDYEVEAKWEDPIRATLGKRLEIISDMLLLENQLPFFVIRKVFGFVHPNGDLASLMSLPLFLCYGDLILCPNKMALDDEFTIINIINNYPAHTTHHFLHLCHNLIVGEGLESLAMNAMENNIQEEAKGPILENAHRLISRLYGAMPESVTQERLGMKLGSLIAYLSDGVKYSSNEKIVDSRIPSASQLQDAGIRFERKKRPVCIFDVSFHKGTMEIPQLHISDQSNSVLRNLTAFEQCYGQVEFSSSAYCYFLDFLVDTPEDAAILQEQGIIVNHMGSKEAVAILTNRMSKGIAGVGSAHFSGMAKDVNEYASGRIHRWRAKLNKDYFSSPWAIISVIAAVFLLILTVVQTVFGIIPVATSG